MEWLLPLCLFWPLTAGLLGGLPVEVVGGGGFRQTAGLVVAFVLFLVVWAGLRAALGGSGSMLVAWILPAVLCVLLLLPILWIGYKVLGVRVIKGSVPH